MFKDAVSSERHSQRALTCILNDKAGPDNSTDAHTLISRVAAEQGWQTRFLSPSSGTDITMLAADVGASGGLVVAGGGDGTISAVAAGLIGADATLGVLPMGTLNHFAKDLGIPLNLEEAVRTLFTGKVATVDVGEVNGRVFLNNSSIGFYPRIVQQREREQLKGRSKWAAFAKAAALTFQRSRTLNVEVLAERGERQSYDTPFIFVGNNRYSISHLEIGTRDGLDKGKLWVCAAPNAGRLKLMSLAVSALFGFISDEDLAAFEASQTVIHVRRRHMLVATDGEVTIMRTPLRYRSRPGALRVMVPSQV